MHLRSLSVSNDRTNNSPKITQNNIQIEFDSIYNLYKNEFLYYCDNLLIKSRNDILDNFFEKMNSLIYYYYKTGNKEKLNIIIKKCENDFISREYIPMYNALSLTLSIISTNLSSKHKIKYSALNKNLNYITNFIPHCLNQKSNNEYAIHTCGEKLLQINKNIIKCNSKNKVINTINDIKYILCPKCKKSYKNNLILMHCNFCQINYFSKLVNEKNNNIYPVTWKKYHCINIDNYNEINNYKYEDQIPCIKCQSKFWLKNNKLFCKNCKFEIEPFNLVWTCIKCAKEFRTNLKIYNSLNHKIIKHIIRDAIIQQKIVKPVDLPCDCLKKYKYGNICFYHKKEGKCNGILLYNSFNSKDYIICSLCKYISYLNDFNWFCPFCLRYFISNKIEIYKNKKNNFNIYIRKNIFENKPKTKRYFSPKHTNNINITDKIGINKIHSDRNRFCSTQKKIDENKYIIIPKISENNDDNNKISFKQNISMINKYSQSTLFTSYQKETFNQTIKYNQKYKSSNNSLEQKNIFEISEKNSIKKPKKTNSKIYISNQKIHSKLLFLEKYNDSISKFNCNKKNENNKLQLDKSLQKEEIKITKPKVYISSISSSLICGSSDNKENNNYLNDNNDKLNDNLISNKLIYSNKTKRNKIYSSKKDKIINNNYTINNNLKKMKKNNLNNKTHYNLSQKKIKEENLQLKNKKLCKKLSDYSLQTTIATQRNKIIKKVIKQKSCDI